MLCFSRSMKRADILPRWSVPRSSGGMWRFGRDGRGRYDCVFFSPRVGGGGKADGVIGEGVEALRLGSCVVGKVGTENVV
jgi:hypothetical protein